MDGGGGKLGKSTEEPGMAGKDIEQGRGGQEGNFFKALVQEVLLFGAETWVLTPRIERVLESFMHGAARRITGNQPRIGGDEKWTYTPLREAMREAGFEGIQKIVTRRQKTVAQ